MVAVALRQIQDSGGSHAYVDALSKFKMACVDASVEFKMAVIAYTSARLRPWWCIDVQFKMARAFLSLQSKMHQKSF